MKISIKNLQTKLPVSPAALLKIKKAMLRVLSQEGVKKPGEIAVCILNDEEIKELNLNYLGKNIPTDVIAFDLSGKNKTVLADIAVSADTAIRNAGIFKTSPLYELYLYIIHGLLHILGYDDARKKEKLIMRKKEEFLLNTLNL